MTQEEYEQLSPYEQKAYDDYQNNLAYDEYAESEDYENNNLHTA
jgi:hypothetical protein